MAGNILPKHYIIGIIMFTFVTVAGLALLNEFNEADPTYIDSAKYTEFNTTFNKFNDITTEVGGIKDGIEGAEPGQDYGTLGVLEALISSGWNTLQLLFSSFGFMSSVFEGLSEVFGVPWWVATLLGLLVTVLFAFAIYSAIFQREL